MIQKVCKTCGKEFTTKWKTQLYCKRKHQPNRIRYRKRSPARKRWKTVHQYKQGISKFFIFQIMLIYSNRPDGYEVDHIVPLNHPDVCGLHVPWNLQYLTKNENLIKSNKFG